MKYSEVPVGGFFRFKMQGKYKESLVYQKTQALIESGLEDNLAHRGDQEVIPVTLEELAAERKRWGIKPDAPVDKGTLCMCCAEARATVKPRFAGPRKDFRGYFCDECWTDPSNRYDLCKHGR